MRCFESLTYFVVPWNGRGCSYAGSCDFAGTVVSRDDHLIAGALATCALQDHLIFL